jgi:hypothetical protein
MKAITITNRPAEPVGGYKIPAACKYVGGISQISMRRLIKRGLIKPNRVLRHIIIPKSELDRFLTS